MSEKKIESRRAFFKKAGKTLGGVAVVAAAAPFIAAAANEANASEKQDRTPQGCELAGCMFECTTGCKHMCTFGCSNTCSSLGRGVK
jgi:hypothetical protein